MTIELLKIGDEAYIEKTFIESDVYLFAGITMDFNPVHVNSVHAKKTIFKGRIVHGLLTAGLISGVLGTKLPGIGTIYLGQDIKFLKPVYIGDTIKAKVRIADIIYEKNIVILETICTNQNGEKVIIGEATVMPPR